MYPDCLENLLGLISEDCSCTDLGAIANESSINLFVDQDPNYDACRFKVGSSDCDLISLLNKSRAEAYRQVSMDLPAVLSKSISVKADSMYYIGQPSIGRYLLTSEVPAHPSIKIATNVRPGAYVGIKKIGLMLSPVSGAFDLDLRVYRLLNETERELLKTWSINVANFSVNTKTVEELRLPCDGYTYLIEYDFDPEVFRVPETRYHCSCGDKIKNAKDFIYEQIFDEAGNKADVKSYGISIPATMGCEQGSVVCSLMNNPDYKTVIGFMVRNKTLQLVLQKQVTRQEVNRTTLLSPEDLANAISNFSMQYTNRLTWFQHEKNFNVDGFCLSCGGPRKINMLTGR
ncbi:hypothetical protein DYBT9275_02770 [Dyadobacter sp. CECT 9275]|uniref:Uncharacterized protein n=1 Tax=Dyadobacter helix TaxID=2822344 RepID=A0A916JET4_9BACT|nr:hypothetical protein [Dyadobacter sp. CECT 9275]CAG5001933.1 hypothetical protein DYBT9275_02770 [Dyadobacter sp. CECT 9275]